MGRLGSNKLLIVTLHAVLLLGLCSTPVSEARRTGESKKQKVKKAEGCSKKTCLEVCPAPGRCSLVPYYPLNVTSRWVCSSLPCKLQTSRSMSGSRSAQAARITAVNEMNVMTYPLLFSSVAMAPKYQFTGKHFLLEQAQRLLEGGATTLKFDLNIIKQNMVHDTSYQRHSWLTLLTSPEFPYLQVLDMPFKTFQIWAGELPRTGRPYAASDIDGVDVYKETYYLTTFLLKRYKNTGKTFLIGHWEGDWAIRDVYDANSKPNPTRVKWMVQKLSEKQRGVDDAKKYNPKLKNVYVWHYAEANLVELSRERGPAYFSMINNIIPQVRPVIDYVSISVGGDSFKRMPDPTPELHANLAYAASKLPAKSAPGMKFPRVFIGEYRFMLRNPDDIMSGDTPTPQLQMQKALWAAASAISWGTSEVLWWATYETEVTKNGNYRGFWLIDNQNRETPLFKAMQQYWLDARMFLRSVMGATGKPPTEYAFRKWAAKRLVELSGTGYKALPPVKAY